MAGEVLVFEDVWLEFDHEPVFQGLSFSVSAGETLVIVSLTGGGKSSILRLAAGIIRPTRGRVLVHGNDLCSLQFDEHQSYLRKAGFVYQNSALLINTTAFDNVALPLRYHHPEMSEAEVERRVLYWLTSFGITGTRDQFPATLSTGERRLVNFARALVVEPDLLIMDDPFTGVPPGVARRTVQTLRGLKHEKGVASLIASETITFMGALADRIAVLREGRIVRTGTVRDFLGQKAAADVGGARAS